MSIRIGYPMTELNPTGEPLDKQRDFHNLNKKFNLFASGFGSGKTLTLGLCAVQESLTYANNYGIIARKDLQELKSTTLKDFFEICPPEVIKSHDKLNKVITFVNGSQIYYMNLDLAREAERKIKSLNLGFVCIDQIEEINDTIFLALQGRLRRQNSSRKLYATCNPAGHDWVWDRWKKEPFEQYCRNQMITLEDAEAICNVIAQRVVGTAYTELSKASKDEREEYIYGEFNIKKSIVKTLYEKWQYGLVEATTMDNRFLPPDYVDSLLQYPENWVKRFVYCSWDDFKGIVYSEFNEKVHVKPAAEIRANIEEYNHFIALDYGYRNPTGVIFAYTDYDNKLYIYNEIYQSGLLVSEICDMIKQNPYWQKATLLIDPSTKRTESTGRAILDDFYEQGLYFTPADNDVLQGILKVNEMFKANKIAIGNNCYHLIDEIGKYKWKELRPSMHTTNLAEAPVKKDDHLMDALRYLINEMYATTDPEKNKPKEMTMMQKLISRNSMSKSFDGSRKPVSIISTF